MHPGGLMVRVAYGHKVREVVPDVIFVNQLQSPGKVRIPVGMYIE